MSKLERRDVKRLYAIASVMMKYGFGPWLDGAARKHRLLIVLKILNWYRQSESLHLPNEARMKKALEELGPIFIKLGQTLSTRADLFEPKYIKELSKLQDKAPPFPWEDARQVIREDFNKEPEEMFKNINPNPISSASIGQVYTALLKNGDRVVVKVQRPGIKKVMEQDIRIMRYLVNFFMSNNPDWEHYDPNRLLDEFADALMRETDYRYEAKYAQMFWKNFEGYKGVRVPRVYSEYSTQRVLVLERLDGMSVREFIAKAAPNKKKSLLDLFANAYLKQVFEDHFFHGDPHPSNLMVLPNGTLAFLDFGNMKKLSEATVTGLASLLQNLMLGDMEALERGFEEEGIVPQGADKQALLKDLEHLYIVCYQTTGIMCDVGKSLEEVISVFRKHHMAIPSEYAALMRSFTEAEGVSKQLLPDFYMFNYVDAYFKEAKLKRIASLVSGDNIKTNMRNVIESLGQLPRNMNLLSKKLADGTIGIELRHQSLNELTIEMDRVSNRVSASILLAAIMVGSALIMQAGITSNLVDIPALGAIGFFLAMILGFWMVIRIIRRSGM